MVLAEEDNRDVKMVMARIIVDKWDIVSKYRRVTS